VLDDRIVFAPDAARHRYTLTVPIAFDRMLSTVVPEWKGQLQKLLASPTGFAVGCDTSFVGTAA
jgi:hypothetical protein